MPGKKSRSLDLLHFIKKFVYNLKMRVFLVGTLGLCLLPACGFAQGGKFIQGARKISPAFNAPLLPQVNRKVQQAFRQNIESRRVVPPSFPAYTKTNIPGVGTVYSFSAMPNDFMIATAEAQLDLPASATVWQERNLILARLSSNTTTFTPAQPEFTDTHLPGLGTVRSYGDKPDLYGLQVPTRRGHMDHFVPMDMKGVVTRLVNYTRQQNFTNAWAQLGGMMQYDDVEPLAEHLHQLYRGQGISVLDPEGEEAVFYMIPLEGMKYRFDGTLLPLNMAEYVVLFYPQRKVSQLLEQSKETLGKFRLIGNDPKIPQE